MTSFLIDIVNHTPIGVWIGLAVLVALGLAQTRDNGGIFFGGGKRLIEARAGRGATAGEIEAVF